MLLPGPIVLRVNPLHVTTLSHMSAKINRCDKQVKKNSIALLRANNVELLEV